MAEEYSDSEKMKEDWMNRKWRPAMGWMYMGICTLDMGVFPILWSVLQTVTHAPLTQWQPLTLQGAGLFHVAMGAVLGIAAFGRTQEKLAGAAQNPSPAAPPPAAFAPPPPASAPVTVTTTFTPPPAPAPVSTDVTMVNGKKAPVQPPFPEI